MHRIAFVGLGRMGHPMARHLLGAGFDLAVWNRTPSRADDLAAAGARRAAAVADAVRGADAVLTMLADDEALEHVVFEERLIDTLAHGAIHVSMSTISARLARTLAADHAARGQHFVSAPVFGRPDAAAAAKLFIVAAGAPAALDRCQPLFDAVGQRTFRFGDEPSAANVVKLSGNVLIAAMLESLGEAFALTRKAGVDPQQFLQLLTGTLFDAPIVRTYGALIARAQFEPAGFSLPLGLKDVSLALDAARGATVPMPIASLVRDRMLAALARGRGGADWSVIAELAAADAGLP